MPDPHLHTYKRAEHIDWSVSGTEVIHTDRYTVPAEVNDLTASVTWANVPDLNITQSSVIQHVGAIDHNSTLNYAANEHIDWTNTTYDLLTSGDVVGAFGRFPQGMIGSTDITA